jgi:pyridoxal phosphate enzyme (YggS family)
MISESYKTVLDNICKVTRASGRNSGDVKLVAVSKYHTPEEMNILIKDGQKVFGENKAQDLVEKAKILKDNGIEWHFIGRIQTNKIKYVVPIAYMIHSVCRMEEVNEIQKRASKIGKVQKILFEVNISGEESKAGISPEGIDELIKYTIPLKNISLEGFMTMAPAGAESSVIHEVFGKLRKLRDKYVEIYPAMRELSMGMSGDYTIAIEEGATMLRIGSAIFAKG